MTHMQVLAEIKKAKAVDISNFIKLTDTFPVSHSLWLNEWKMLAGILSRRAWKGGAVKYGTAKRREI